MECKTEKKIVYKLEVNDNELNVLEAALSRIVHNHISGKEPHDTAYKMLKQLEELK